MVLLQKVVDRLESIGKKFGVLIFYILIAVAILSVAWVYVHAVEANEAKNPTYKTQVLVITELDKANIASTINATINNAYEDGYEYEDMTQAAIGNWIVVTIVYKEY
jgi:hypothetical protein